jgi:acyl dehydratase
VRFIRPVAVGDTITAAYAPLEGGATYPESGTTLQFRAEARNQRGEVVAAGRHLMYRLESAEVARG